MRLYRITVLSFFALLLLAGRATAASVTLAWDRNSEPDVAGYIVHYGVVSRAYTTSIDVGNVTSWRVDGLAEGKTYYFAVQAYTSTGVVSPLSSEVQAFIGVTKPVLLPPAQFITLPGADGSLASLRLEWTQVADAEAYYLYVGTSSGAKDVVDTGEINATSYTLSRLPGHRTYFARIWTRQQGVWRYSEMVFKLPAPPGPAQLLTPSQGERGVNSSRTFVWTEVPGAQAYYLYVGTQPGAKDVVDSAEIGVTQFKPASLPAGRRLYARLWTKVQDQWAYKDTYFDSAPAAELLYPTPGTSDVSEAETFRWTAISDAEAYYLYVGTSPGAKDVVDTGEIMRLSHDVTGLAPGRMYYARLWTKVMGTWKYTDVPFRTSLSARFTSPGDGAGTGLGQGFKWTSIRGAQAYYLYLGTQEGAKDLVDTGEVLTRHYPTPLLPGNQELHGRIWTKLGGVWRARDQAFRLPGAYLTTPEPGGVASQIAQTFAWTSIANAEVYYLYVGTTPGAKDVVDTGEITTTSYVVPNLPPNRKLYVTLWTKIDGIWRNTTSDVFVK